MSAVVRYTTFPLFLKEYAPDIRDIFHYVFHHRCASVVFLSGPIEDVLQQVGSDIHRFSNVAIFSRYRDACRYHRFLQDCVQSVDAHVGRSEIPADTNEAVQPLQRMQRMRLRVLVRR